MRKQRKMEYSAPEVIVLKFAMERCCMSPDTNGDVDTPESVYYNPNNPESTNETLYISF